MNTHAQKNLKTIIFIIFVSTALLLSSCVPQKKIRYVQNKNKKDTLNTFILKQRPKNTVQPFDNLYIKVISPDQETSQMFNSESSNAVQQSVNYNMISYTVNDSGYVDFPFVGLIYVKDLTILQAKDAIQEALHQYISNAAVIVKFVGKSVTVIGEVMRQGEYVIYSDDISIFKALALAGGITDFGNREEVIIIREDDKKVSYHTVDLTDKKVALSDFYYLKPNDIVVVQPLGQKSYGFAQFPYTLLLTGLTTLIVVLSFISTF